MKIKEICVDERPREKMLAKGADAMSNAELLAILIGSGTQKENVLEVANRLLAEGKGKLSMIADMDARRMKEIGGIGSCVRKLSSVIPICFVTISPTYSFPGKRCCLEDPGIEKVPLTDAEIVYRMMLPRLKGLDHEEFWVILLNRANYIIHKEMISLGGISSTVVDSKLVVRMALDKRASGLIMVHNHPSGNPRPGHNDLTETERMKKAANTFDIALLDHIIICDDCYFSFADDKVTVAERKNLLL